MLISHWPTDNLLDYSVDNAVFVLLTSLQRSQQNEVAS